MDKYLLVHNNKTKEIRILKHIVTNNIIGYVDLFDNSKSVILRFWMILKQSNKLSDIIGNEYCIIGEE